MQIVRELNLQELTFTAITMLTGKVGKDFAYYDSPPTLATGEQDTDWWALRLSTRLN